MSAVEVPSCEKVMLTIPADALATEADVEVLVWMWADGPVEADVRTPAHPSVVWTPLSLVGGVVRRVE